MVTVKIRRGEDGKLVVQFPYDPVSNAKIKAVPGCIWIPEKKVWKIPYSEEALEQLRKQFAGFLLDIDLSVVSEVTRRNIIDYIIAMYHPFHGRLGLIPFLSRIWDLSEMPSTDSRFENAKGDIWQHMENNSDWDEQYLFYEYLDILKAPVETFLKLIEQVVHPIVVSDDGHVLEMVSTFNGILAHDGYVLVAESEISGHPVYKAVPSHTVDQELIMMSKQIPTEIQRSIQRFREDHPDPLRTAFIMMRFVNDKVHNEITAAIRSTLLPYGVEGLRADDRYYHDDLFPNVLTYMHGCGIGIAVFERITTDEFNPNVSLEVGYMLALGKPVCLLKDKTLTALQADLIGKLYSPFDTHNIMSTINVELSKWLLSKDFVS